MSTILITGANGFVGQHLGAYLVTQGHQVVAATRGTDIDVSFSHSRIAPVGEIGVTTDWRAALEGVEVVIHLAARVHVMREQAVDPLTEFQRVNTDGTLSLARQAAEMGVKRLVYISSIKVNGERTQSIPFNEKDEVRPEDPYACSKYEAEQQLLDLTRQCELEVTIVRPPLVYGPGVGGNFQRLLGLAAKGWPLPLAGIHNQRSLINIWNLCNFLEVCSQHPRAAGEVFLIADGEDISTPDLIQKLAEGMEHRAHLFVFPKALLHVTAKLAGQEKVWERLAGSLQVNIGKSRQLLGWAPIVSLDEGLARTATWYQESSLANR